MVGPEGGLSAAEIDFLKSIGFHPIYLGPSVLRVETAAILALGAILVSLLERDRWSLR
jgi:16S rRNA (uracil1498-N3)-methyltransferase